MPKVVPYIWSTDCAKHLQWLSKVFGAETYGEVHKDEKDGKIMHCAVKIGKGIIFMSDYGKESEGRGNVQVYLDLDDTDTPWGLAVKEGAKVDMELADQFWGMRWGCFVDPFNVWWSVAGPVSKKEE